MIPRILHQVWVGPDPLPDDFAQYRRSWQRHHPHWEMRFWTEENLPGDLRRREAYERLRVPAERSDIIRLEVLHSFGGLYVDTDFECRQPVDPLLDGVEFCTAYLKPGRVNNALIGASPQHPIIDRALTELEPREFNGYDKRAAGPLFFDNLIKDYPEITIFAPELFYPSTPEQREQAYAIHHSARSWKDAEGFRQATLRAEERLDRALRELEKERRGHNKTKKQLEALKGDVVALKARGKRGGKAAGERVGDGEPAADADAVASQPGAFSFLRSRGR